MLSRVRRHPPGDRASVHQRHRRRVIRSTTVLHRWCVSESQRTSPSVSDPPSLAHAHAQRGSTLRLWSYQSPGFSTAANRWGPDTLYYWPRSSVGAHSILSLACVIQESKQFGEAKREERAGLKQGPFRGMSSPLDFFVSRITNQSNTSPFPLSSESTSSRDTTRDARFTPLAQQRPGMGPSPRRCINRIRKMLPSLRAAK
jgi:hypothetical protein